MDGRLDRECELRTHIRQLLLQYALTHLTTNYVVWTHETVSNLLLHSLVPVPLTAPTSVSLPADPLETLSQKWGLSSLDIYEERWEIDNSEVLPYTKQLMLPANRRSATSDSSWEDADDQHTLFHILRPLSPVLTARARRETPRPEKGASTYATGLPHNNTCLPSSCGIRRTECQDPQDAPINTDDALGNKLLLDSQTHQQLLDLFDSLPMLGRKSRGISETRAFDDFLRTDSPSPDLPEPEMIPLFPRNHQPGRLSEQSNTKPSQLATLLHKAPRYPESWLAPFDVKEEDDDDLANEHLVIVDGWSAIKTSSSPLAPGTPSLADSSSDIDELLIPSSDIDIEDPYMEEFQIARVDKIGGTRTRPIASGRSDNLSAFLSPHLRGVPRTGLGPRIVHSPKSQPSSPRTSITMSMLGQHSMAHDSDFQTVIRPLDGAPSSDDTIHLAVKAIEGACGESLGDEDPANLVMTESLDEKDSILMDVPIMRPPNEHVSGKSLAPTRLTDLVAPVNVNHPSSHNDDVATLPGWSGYLKTMKGLQSLHIELSWIPFKYGRTVPTDEEVADVINDPCPQLAKDIELTHEEVTSRLALLLDETMLFTSQPPDSDSAPSTVCWATDDDPDPIPGADPMPFTDGSVLILGRSDRRRLAGLLPLTDLEHEAEFSTSDKENEGEYFQPDESCPLPLMKKVRFDEVATTWSMDQYLGSDHEDSGVFFDEPEPVSIYTKDKGSSFVQLSDDSEGFDGPKTDGDLFPDIHPIHYGNTGFDVSAGLDTDVQFFDHRNSVVASPLLANDRISLVQRLSLGADTTPANSLPLYGAVEEPPEMNTLHKAAEDAIPPVSRSPLHGITTQQRGGLSDSVDFALATTGILVPSARQSLDDFLAVHGKASLLTTGPRDADESHDPAPSTIHPGGSGVSSAPRETPPELVDDKTWVLSADYEPPTGIHRYMASMNLVERRALVRALSSYCAVDLIEREHLGEGVNGDDVHLIVDCDCAVLFTPLELLPARGETVSALLTRLSWRYSRILVVFECYPSVWDYSGDKEHMGKLIASVWSPPVVKAVRKLRRDLSISEGLQTKCVKTVVEYAFANTVEDAAAFARVYGDAAEARDSTRGAVWGERSWLTLEERDGEYELCCVDGMNLFVASLLLSQITLEDFLEKSADDRFLEFGDLVGIDKITRFNVEMVRRLEIIQLPPSSPFNVDASSSLDSVPYFADSDEDVDVKG